jgi:hypothetical protein
MNNLKERNLVPTSVQGSSEDPPGFIYPTYRAAQTETRGAKPSSTPHIGPHRQKPVELSLLWRVHIKGLPTYPPLLVGLYPHSPSGKPLPRTGSGLVGVSEEASETG